MAKNAIAISRRLEERGVDKRLADAVAEEIVEYHSDHSATKADVARLDTKVNVILSILAAFFVAWLAHTFAA